MKVSDLIRELETYKKVHGDDEVEFDLRCEDDGDDDAEELTFIEIHDGYTSRIVRVCEIRLEC